MRKQFFTLALCIVIGLSFPLSANAVGNTGFSDVDETAAYAEAIRWAAERGYINGYSDGRFGVNDPVTRAQMAAIFYRAASESPTGSNPQTSGPSRFPDVPATAYYVNAAGWAEDNGLINGYPDGRFGVNDPVTRQQVAAILWRWAGRPAASAADYADESAIAAYAQTAVDWSRANQIMTGREDGRFAPNENATRAEIVSALYQHMNPPSNQEPPTSNETKETIAMPKLRIEAGGQIFTATLLDNRTTRALMERLPMTVSMGELNGNEKYYYMSDSLPTNAQRPGSIHTGDLMLYGSDCLVLFYESFSSGYSYTRLGSIDDPSGLAAALGKGNVEVTFQAA